MRAQALKELFYRYWQVCRASWSLRKEITPSERTKQELTFLPAALELQETPPHPATRIALWSIIAFLTITVLWAVFGKIDVVAVASGKLVVSDRSKIVQPLESGVVKAIHIHDGQYVQAGQVLIELDSTITGADSDKNTAAWLDAKLEALRSQALLNALDSHQSLALPTDPELAHASLQLKIADAQRLVRSQWQEFQAKLATIDADTARKRAERAGAQEQVRKLEQTLPIITKRAANYKDLLDQGIVEEQVYMEKVQTRIETEHDLGAQREKFKELTEGLTTNHRQKDSIIAEFRHTQHDNLVKASEKARELAQEVVKAKHHNSQTSLTAPVSGIVQQLAVHTVGGVVTPAQALLVVVPREDTLEAEAMLENKDIGFVRSGQNAAVKIETFNYTKYGLVDGKVETVSLDAIQDEERGLVYATRIRLNRHCMNIDGKTVKLSPGMAVTVEIKTSQRRVIEYFLSPLIQNVSESLKER